MLTWIGYGGAALIAVVIAFGAYVRLAEHDADRWHLDPMAAPDPGQAGIRVLPEDGPVLAATPAEALAAFDAVAMAEPRTERLAGSVADGHITYVTRSALWGFPDYTSVRAEAVPGGAAFAVYGRLRFGQADMGVNAARVTRWLEATEARLTERAA